MTDSMDDYESNSALAEYHYEELLNQIEIMEQEIYRRKLYPQSIPVNYEWETKNGEIIPIGKISDKHLSNILKMLKRKI